MIPLIIHIELSDTKQHALVSRCIESLEHSDKLTLDRLQKPCYITALVDGLGLACPLPLLKTKIALRSMSVGESVYVLATDPNSQLDLATFCHQTGLDILLSTQSSIASVDTFDNRLEKLDTIFHVIITKTDGN